MCYNENPAREDSYPRGLISPGHGNRCAGAIWLLGSAAPPGIFGLSCAKRLCFLHSLPITSLTQQVLTQTLSFCDGRECSQIFQLLRDEWEMLKNSSCEENEKLV